MEPGAVAVVTSDPESAVFAEVRAALAAASLQLRPCAPDAIPLERPVVLLDDPALAPALRSLRYRQPGATVYSHVVLALTEPRHGMTLTSEGVRDIVRPQDAGRAADAALRGSPPLYLQRMLGELREHFLPAMTQDMKARVTDRATLLEECLLLTSGIDTLEEKLTKLRRKKTHQLADDLIWEQQDVRRFERALQGPSLKWLRAGTWRRHGAVGLKTWNERDVRKQGRLIEDTFDDLRYLGVHALLSQADANHLADEAPRLRSRPLATLTQYRQALERALEQRLGSLSQGRLDNPVPERLQSEFLEPQSLGVVAPGFVVPRYIAAVLASLVQPPADLYQSWGLDLRDLKLKQCSAVIADIGRNRHEGDSDALRDHRQG